MLQTRLIKGNKGNKVGNAKGNHYYGSIFSTPTAGGGDSSESTLAGRPTTSRSSLE